MSFPVSPGAEITLEGQSCTLKELADLQATGSVYNCTVVYDNDGNVVALDVSRPVIPASVEGTISDVKIDSSTITVQTNQGPKVYQVDANGLLIDGLACSLNLVGALYLAGADMPCTVIYDVNDQGQAVYIDINSDPRFPLLEGTLTSVDVSQSTVTVQTDQGPMTLEIDPATGMFLNGQACQLGALDEYVGDQGPCPVVYFTDKDGNLIAIDGISYFVPQHP